MIYVREENIERKSNKDLEQVNGGASWDEPVLDVPIRRPEPKPVEESCGDFFEDRCPYIPTGVKYKKLYTYCSRCVNWMGDSCKKGHF